MHVPPQSVSTEQIHDLKPLEPPSQEPDPPIEIEECKEVELPPFDVTEVEN